MDPIHPIVPVAPSIPAVAPAPMVGGVHRDASHTPADERRRRRRPAPGQVPADPDQPPADDDDSGLHVNVMA